MTNEEKHSILVANMEKAMTEAYELRTPKRQKTLNRKVRRFKTFAIHAKLFGMYGIGATTVNNYYCL